MRRNRDLLLSRRLRVRETTARAISGKQLAPSPSSRSRTQLSFLVIRERVRQLSLRKLAGANYTTVRKFLIEPRSVAGETLFLDAPDEYRTIASGQDASAEVSKALCSLKKPKFRLSCRAADWFGSPDQEALRVASASGRVVVLELLPLSRDEILNAVHGIVPDPAAFLDEAESAGLGKLLGNPQTLILIAQAWGAAIRSHGTSLRHMKLVFQSNLGRLTFVMAHAG